MTQNLRMNETARNQFDPAGILARRAAFAAAQEAVQVELEARLDEREIAGPQPDLNVALKDLAERYAHNGDEIRDRNILIDDDPFALIERVLVARVDRFVAEAAAGEDRANRRAETLERADLVRRRMRAQNELVLARGDRAGY